MSAKSVKGTPEYVQWIEICTIHIHVHCVIMHIIVPALQHYISLVFDDDLIKHIVKSQFGDTILTHRTLGLKFANSWLICPFVRTVCFMVNYIFHQFSHMLYFCMRVFYKPLCLSYRHGWAVIYGAFIDIHSSDSPYGWWNMCRIGSLQRCS